MALTRYGEMDANVGKQSKLSYLHGSNVGFTTFFPQDLQQSRFKRDWRKGKRTLRGV